MFQYVVFSQEAFPLHCKYETHFSPVIGKCYIFLPLKEEGRFISSVETTRHPDKLPNKRNTYPNVQHIPNDRSDS